MLLIAKITSKNTKNALQFLKTFTCVRLKAALPTLSIFIVKRIPNNNLNAVGVYTLKKTLWPLFMDGVQPPQGYSHFEESVYFLPLSSQKFLVLILSTS